MNLYGEFKQRLETIFFEYMSNKPASLHSVLSEVFDSIKLGEVVDSYQARYIRDALYSTEELKTQNADILSVIEKEFF